MADYAETKQSLLNQSCFGNLMGVPLHGQRKRKGWMPIIPCICTEADGCPCDTLDDVIVWIPASVNRRKTGKRCAGEEILTYDVARDSRIYVEAQFPMTVAQLQNAKHLARSGSRRTRIVFHRVPNEQDHVSVSAILVRAFELGWHVGEKLDSHTSISEKVSDWFANVFARTKHPGTSVTTRSKTVVKVQPGAE